MSRGRVKANKVLVKVWLFVLFFLPITTWLGFWQLERAEQKHDLLAEREQQSDAMPQSYKAGMPIKRFKLYELAGRYLDESFLLDNRQRQGTVGYELLSLFQLESGDKLLVNRGWLAAPKYRSEEPDFSTLKANARLVGYFYWSDKPLPESSADKEILDWKAVRVQSIPWLDLNNQFGGMAESVEFRLASEQQAGAQNISWKYAAVSPQKHKGYAVQWFAMAVALVVLGIWSSFTLREPQAERSK